MSDQTGQELTREVWSLRKHIAELQAELDRVREESNQYRIEADCAMRDYDGLDNEHGLALDRITALQEREERLRAALTSIERGEDGDPVATASDALEEEWGLSEAAHEQEVPDSVREAAQRLSDRNNAFRAEGVQRAKREAREQGDKGGEAEKGLRRTKHHGKIGL